MSAIILYKTSSLGNENTLVVEPRTGLWIPFNFGTWTELRMGMYFSGPSSSSGYQTRYTTGETVAITTDADRFAFGLISGSNVGIHGTAGTRFVGVISNQANVAGEIFFAHSGYQSAGNSAGSSNGTSVSIGTDLNNAASPFSFNHPDRIDGNHCGFKGLKITVLNPGAGNQSIRIGTFAGNVAMPYDISSLRTRLNNSTYTNYPSDPAWSSGTPWDLPNNFYIWNPYYGAGIKISALEILKVS